MKSLLLLMVVPVVLGGGPEFMKMWSEMEKEMGRTMPESGNGDSPMAGGDRATGVPKQDDSDAEMMKKMQEMMGWSEEKKQEPMKGESEEAMKGWGDEAMKGWSDDAMKGWGDEAMKGWSEEAMKGWSDDAMKGWSEEAMKGWGEEQMKGWNEEAMKGWSQEQQKPMDDKAKMLEAFKSFMKEQAEHMKEEEPKQKSAAAFEDFMKKYKEHEEQMAKEKMEAMHKAALQKHDLMMNFKQYLMQKKQEKMEQEQAREAMMKRMKQMKMQYMLSKKLSSMMEEYDSQKFQFVAGVTGQLLSFCQKSGSKNDPTMRIKAGQFGDEQRMRDDGAMGEETIESHGPEDAAAQQEQMKQAFVNKFLGLEHEEQGKLVLHYMVESMCHAAEGVVSHLRHLEAELLHQMHHKAIAGPEY